MGDDVPLNEVIRLSEKTLCLPKLDQSSVDLEDLEERKVLLLPGEGEDQKQDVLTKIGTNFEINPKKCLELDGEFDSGAPSFDLRVCVDGLDLTEAPESLLLKSYCLGDADAETEEKTLADLIRVSTVMC